MKAGERRWEGAFPVLRIVHRQEERVIRLLSFVFGKQKVQILIILNQLTCRLFKKIIMRRLSKKNIFIHSLHTRIGARISVVSLIAFLKTPCIVFKLHKR